ncbi:hypothetical protein PVAG01_01597 [Phlyctema vagabunda]|uniref:Uncharacterized protein n=1 Tax=Phlyctema vagabunda TaxID=108571 RepID=A0ABR4PXK7_9HELO
MGSGKADIVPQAPVYRDNPDRDDTASTSSAVLLGDFEASYIDEEPPEYCDVEAHPDCYYYGCDANSLHSKAPTLPFSQRNTFGQATWTSFPEYSTRAEVLEQMLRTQAMYPPTYILSIHGTHTETVRRHGKSESKNRVTDFWIKIDITHLLTSEPGRNRPNVDDRIELLAHNQRGYRGGVFPSKRPIPADVEEGKELGAWCERFVSNPARVKSFTLKKEITNHDTKKVEQLVRSLVASTFYRGHLSVDFVMQDHELIVFSPSKINELRTIRWLRWFCYLTFLWMITWPILFFKTKKYEVAKAIYPYSYDQGEQRPRKPAVMSELEFYNSWESALRRGILSRFEGLMDDEYRIHADARGIIGAHTPQLRFNGGSSFTESVARLLDAGLAYSADVRDSRGWGADS